jgi:hypothetical protein
MFTADERQNFEMLCRAVQNRDVALLDCRHLASGETVSVICATNRLENGLIEFIPLARMLDANMGEFLLRCVSSDPPGNPELN